LDNEFELSEEQVGLLRAIEAQGHLRIGDADDPRAAALRGLGETGHVRALPLRTTGECCMYVLSGLGIAAAAREAPTSRGAWEA
jgi:hypothetical protein